MEKMTSEMHESTVRMEQMTKSMKKIAAKTEKETASMHIITLVTLVFLPGTFVAVRFGLPILCKFFADLTSDQTFFGSGLFQWDQNNPLEFPAWKPEFFALFAKICFPLMGGTILIWTAPYFWMLWRHGRKKGGDEEPFSSDTDDSNTKVRAVMSAVPHPKKGRGAFVSFLSTLVNPMGKSKSLDNNSASV